MESDIPLKSVSIPGDGACLFSSISYLLYGHISKSIYVRNLIVNHVFNNWERFECFTQQASNKPYDTKQSYFDDMSKPFTKGSLCEVKAAAELFLYEFQVYQNNCLIAIFNRALGEIKRLRFTGNYHDGHCDVLIPLFEPMNIDVAQIQNNLNDNHESETNGVTNLPFSSINSHTVLSSCDESISVTETFIPSKRGTKRRKRFSDAIRIKQRRKAASKYAKNHKEVNRDSVRKYAKSHPKPKLLSWTSKYLSGFKYNSKINYSNNKIVNLGPRLPCFWCRALKWKDETQGMCCSSGKVQLSKLGPYPEPLHSLLTHQDPLSEHFLKNARKYNGCFQMTSFGAKEVREGNFMPTFKVQGQVCPLIGSLIPEPNQNPSFLQIYFIGDENNEKDIRCRNYPDVYPELVRQLQVLLHEHNTYIQDFKAVVDAIPEDQKDFKIIINADKKLAGEHKGRYNVPQAKEVAVFIVGQNFEKRDIVIHSRDNKLIRISEIHRSYDALQYPLIFCYGEDGYHINVPKRDETTKLPLDKTVSASEFYSFRIMERENDVCYLLRFRNLLSQFLVDMYAKIETERLNWIRNNQKTLRSEEYVHLKDALSKNYEELSMMGKMVELPSSFTGGPRYMHERTQDAMTYVRHYGRPDLFITFTCNPKWPEITEHLSEGQQSHDRHDIITRVFHIKVKHMMKLLTECRIFGDTRCYMYTIEWQKRGLPHVHILLWLKERIRPESIDQIICAELPDPNQNPDLYQIITTTMIHGPCGSLNPKSPCMVDGDETVFKKLHVHFTWMLKAGGHTYTETLYTSQDLLNKLQPNSQKGTIFEQSLCSIPSSQECIGIRNLENMLTKPVFRILLYCTLVGIQIAIRTKTVAATIIKGLSRLMPDTGKTYSHITESNGNEEPSVVLCILENENGNYVCDWTGQLPVKCPTLMNRIETAMSNEKFNDEVLHQHIKSLQLEWVGIAKAVKAAIQSSGPKSEAVTKLKQIFGIAQHDDVLINFWMNIL